MIAAGAAVAVWLGVLAAFAARAWFPASAVVPCAALFVASLPALLAVGPWRRGVRRHVQGGPGPVRYARGSKDLWPTLTLGAVSLTIAAFGIGSLHLLLTRPPVLTSGSGSVFTAIATLRSEVRVGTDWTGMALPSARTTAILTDIRADDRQVPGRALAGLHFEAQQAASLTRGSRVEVRFRVTAYEPWRSPGLAVRALSLSGADPPGVVLAGVDRMRSSLQDVLGCCDRDAGALLAGLAIGADERQSDSLQEAMRRSGLSHLTAVSGGNISILVGVVLWLAAWSGLRLYGRLFAGLLAVLGYIVIVGWEPSVLRAGVMGTVALLAVLRGGGRGGIGLLGGSVVLLILVQPELAIAWGMALSVAATAGIIVFAGRWQRRLTDRFPRIPAPLLATVTVTAAAQMTTAPLLAAMAGQVSLAALPANALAAALVAPITVLGLLALLLAWPAPLAASAVASAGSVASGVLAQIAHRCAALPLAAIDLPDGWAGAGLVVATLVIAMLTWFVLRTGLGGHDTAPRAWEGLRGRARGPWMALLASGLAASAVVALFASPTASNVPDDWLVVACDVEQGDAFLARVGPSSAVLIDTGEHPEMLLDCLDRTGIQSLPLVFLTHFDTDHVSSLPQLLRDRSVGRVVFAPVPDPAANAQAVREVLRQTDIPHEIGSAGAAWRIGGAHVELLWPQRLVRAGGAPGNNSGLVVRVRAGVDMLFTGDIEPAGQLALMHLRNPPRVEATTIPHHGSANQHPRFPDWTGARLALVSAGENNRYGHPRQEALDLFAGAGMQIGRTDEHGTVAMTRNSQGALMLHALGG